MNFLKLFKLVANIPAFNQNLSIEGGNKVDLSQIKTDLSRADFVNTSLATNENFQLTNFVSTDYNQEIQRILAGIKNFENLNLDEGVKNDITFPDNFEDIKFEEFISDSGTIKTAVFFKDKRPVVTISSQSGVKEILLEEAIAKNLDAVDIAYDKANNVILVSHPVSLGQKEEKFAVRIAHYDAESGQQVQPSNDITIEKLEKCFEDKQCEAWDSQVEGNLEGQGPGKFFITGKSGAIDHYEGKTVVTLQMREKEFEDSPYDKITHTIQVLVDDEGEIIEVGSTYSHTESNSLFLRGAQNTEIIDSKYDGIKLTYSTYYETDNYVIAPDGPQLKFVKSVIDQRDPDVGGFFYGACFGNSKDSCSNSNARKSFNLAQGDVQAHHMGAFEGKQVVMAWAQNNTVSTYSLLSSSDIKYDNNNQVVGKQEMFCVVEGNITAVNVAHDVDGDTYISAVDNNNHFHCQKVRLGDDGQLMKEGEVIIIENITPEVFARKSVVDLYNENFTTVRPTEPTTTKSTSTSTSTSTESTTYQSTTASGTSEATTTQILSTSTGISTESTIYQSTTTSGTSEAVTTQSTSTSTKATTDTTLKTTTASSTNSTSPPERPAPSGLEVGLSVGGAFFGVVVVVLTALVGCRRYKNRVPFRRVVNRNDCSSLNSENTRPESCMQAFVNIVRGFDFREGRVEVFILDVLGSNSSDISDMEIIQTCGDFDSVTKVGEDIGVSVV